MKFNHYSMTVYEHLDMFVTLKNKGSKQDQKEEIHRQELVSIFNNNNNNFSIIINIVINLAKY